MAALMAASSSAGSNTPAEIPENARMKSIYLSAIEILCIHSTKMADITDNLQTDVLNMIHSGIC